MFHVCHVLFRFYIFVFFMDTHKNVPHTQCVRVDMDTYEREKHKTKWQTYWNKIHSKKYNKI